MSKDEGGWNSSFSEKPVRSNLRRLVGWINLTGAKKVHSLIDKVYKRKNLEMAWEKVKENRGSGGIDGQSLTAFAVDKGCTTQNLEGDSKRAGSVDHEKLLTLVAQRVADGRVLRLIKAMLKAGSYGKGQLFPSERGTP